MQKLDILFVMHALPIPEFEDEDRAVIQAVGALTECWQAVIEALQPIVEILTELCEKLCEVFRRFQVYAVLARLRFPGAEWISERWPKGALPIIRPKVFYWALGM